METTLSSETILTEKLRRVQEFERKFIRRADRPRERRGNFSGSEYIDFRNRCRQFMQFLLRKKPVFDVSENHKWSLSWYLDGVKSRKQNRKERFETQYRFQLHFFQASLHADYGAFDCTLCGREFYHSPTDIYLGVKKISDCACGHCANNYAQSKGQGKIYN